MKELSEIVQALHDRDCAGAVLATLFRVEGSSYRRPGARLLLFPDGVRIGSISGGCLEEDLVHRARNVARTGKPEVIVYDTTSENDLVWGVGLGCHGVVHVFVERLDRRPDWAVQLAENSESRRVTSLVLQHTGTEPRGTYVGEAADSGLTYSQAIPPPWALLIFGAGDDAQPLARLATGLGWKVMVADPRPAFATSLRFPTAERVIVGPAAELPQRVAFDRWTVAVVMTHHYVHDVPILRGVLSQPLAYLGLLGPKKRAERILADLSHEGIIITPERRARLHAPVGLDLGADGAEEVALAIVAEIQATLSGRTATPLRERDRAIHA